MKALLFITLIVLFPFFVSAVGFDSPFANGFIENKGQVVDIKQISHPEVLCTYEEPNAKLFFTKEKIVYLFYRYETEETAESRKKLSEGDVEGARMLSLRVREQRIDFEFVGSNQGTTTQFSKPSENEVNYYKANCPKGITGLKPYSELKYNNLFPNIDIIFKATPSGVKYDIIMKPGAKFSDIKFRYNGSESVQLSDGNLMIDNTLFPLQETIPASYTEKDNEPFAVEYYVSGNNTFGFKPQGNEADIVDETLIIDPILQWSTYFEPTTTGASTIRGNTTVDVNGNFFFQVNTYAANMPLMNPGGTAYYDPSYNPSSGLDMYFAKFDVNYQLVWSTYLGGTGNQSNYYDHGLATYNGYFYICGNTNSSDFPLLNQGGGAYYYTYPGSNCGFLSKFNITSGQMIHSTYLKSYDYHSMAIDKNGNIAVGSFNYTWSVAPVVMSRTGAYNQATHGGDSDVFLYMFNNSLVQTWGTYFGGVGYIDMMGMTFDGNNNLFLLTRGSSNTSVPLANPGGGAYYVSTVAGSYDLSISKFNTSGALTWSTYYGGSALEGLSYSNIRVNSSNDIIITSETFSTNFPTANQGGSAYFQGTAPTGGSQWGCYLRFNNNGVRQHATYVGYNGEDNYVQDNVQAVTGRQYLLLQTKAFPITSISGNYSCSNNVPTSTNYMAIEFDTDFSIRWSSFLQAQNNYFERLGIDNTNLRLYAAGSTSYASCNLLNPGSPAYYDNTRTQSNAHNLMCFDISICVPSTAPSSASASPNPICPSLSTTLSVSGGSLGTGASWHWYSGSCGGTAVGTGATLSVSPVSTTTYYVRAEGDCGTTACVSVTVTVNPSPSNDNCVNAVNIAALPYNSGVMSNSCSTNDIPAGSGCLGFGANVWFTFTGTGNNMQISTDNAGTNFDTELHIYTGSCGSLTEVTCDDDAGTGATSLINLCSTASTTYYVSVGYYSTSLVYGNYQLTIVDYPLGASTSLSASPATICSGSSSTLSGTVGTNGNNISWYTGSCGGSLVGSSTSLSVSPTVTTTYYARTLGSCGNVSATCNTVTVTVNTNSTAPTSISATSNPICSGSTTLSVVGGSLGTGASWQWYTGSCGGTSVGTGSSISVSPASTTTYYVRAEGTCNTTTCASLTVTVNTSSTAPTSISATTNPTCGGSTTLSVVGGSLGTGASWQWFTGSCGGTSAGSGSSISVSPSSTTTYYVRASGTCNTTTCASLTVTVNTSSTAPTSISATSNPICSGSTTLSVVGGSLGTGASWQWYTGSCGGTSVGTGSSISVSPSSSTTYYVRAEGTCNTTTCASLTITVNTSSTAPTSISATTNPTCGGSTTLSVVGGSLGTGASWQWFTGSCGGTSAGSGSSISVSPSSTTTYYVRASGTCNTTTCASLTVTVNTNSTAPTSINATTNPTCGGSTTLSVVGGSLGTGASWEWFTGSCGGTSAGSGSSISVSPSSTTTYFVRASGTCNTTTCASLTVTVSTNSTAPTSISATTNPTCGGSTTLTVVGGSLGTGASWQWYTGSCGGSSAGSGASISVSPGSSTTYYVRAEGTCNTTTCASLTVTVNTNSTAPVSINATTNPTCGGSTTLTVVGGSLGTGADWYWYSGSCGGTAAGTGTSIVVSPSSTTTYYVRAQGTCNTTTCASVTITVNTSSTAPTSITASETTVCSGTNVSLTLAGGSLGTGASWYWYTGSCGGTLIGSGTSTLNVTPSATTTYYVRAEGTCNTTTCASVTITVNTNSVAATSISASQTTICAGTSVNLTLVGGSLGTGAGWYWYSGSCGGTAEGSSTTTINVSPTTTTTYYVRAQETCGNTACVSVTINVNTPSVAPTTAVASPTNVCSGAGVNLSITGGTLGTGADWYWYSGSCGGTAVGTGSSISVNPTVNTTYYVRAEGTCNTTTCAQVSVTIKEESVAVTSAQASPNPICQNQSTTLSITGGSLGDGASWYWYSGSCGGALAGTGNSITVSPASTTTYYVRAEGDCNTTLCQSVQVNVIPLPDPGLDASLTICSSDSPVNLFNYLGGTPDAGGIWVDPTSTQITVPINPETAIQGIYLYVISGADPCSADTAEIDLTILDAPKLDSLTITANTMCNTPYNGAVEFHVTGAGGSYQFSLDGGPTQGTAIFTALTAGTHTYSITGVNTCAISGSFVVGSNTGFAIDSILSTNILCNGENNGEINIYALNAVQYSIDNGANYSANGTFTGLSAGTYSIIVINSGNCQAVQTVSITQPFILNTDTMVSSAICGATGSAQVICNGGVPPYSFEWNNGILTANNNNLTPGTYFVTVTDHNGCTITNSAIVGFTPGTGSASVDTFANVSCNGLADGLLEVGMNFGIPPYTYNWQHDATNNTPEANNLSAGTYYVTINDNYGCSASFTYTISQPTVLTATHNVNNATCGPTGSISVSPSGGTSPFIGVWNTTDTTLNLTQLSAGFYSVTVIDAHLCTTTIDNIEIIDGGGSGSAEISNLDSISCHGSQDGSITVSMPLGFLPITYNWLHDPSLNSATASNLQPGQYVVTLTDSYGCTAIVNATMTEPAILGGIFVAHQTLCHGTPSGSIELSVSGGTPQYSYAWSNGVTIEDLTDVPTGFYSITVTDAHGCTWNANDIYVRDAPAMTVIQDITNITCNGDGNGSIALTILGGNEPYQVAWSNGNSGLSITGLDVGTYVSTVTDDNNCVISDTATLFQPLAINGTLATISPECHNSPNGSVYVSEISGGLPPYAYEWNNSIVTDSLLSHIMPGSYTITITDSLGCAYTMTAIVQNSDNICLVIPDVFTPNGDQINETFEILGIEAFMEAEMQIYNRWGDMLFKSTYYNEFWDGTWKGEPVPMGAYVFILDLKNGEPPIQGVVTVVY